MDGTEIVKSCPAEYVTGEADGVSAVWLLPQPATVKPRMKVERQRRLIDFSSGKTYSPDSFTRRVPVVRRGPSPQASEPERQWGPAVPAPVRPALCSLPHCFQRDCCRRAGLCPRCLGSAAV